jgi:hypothetical protein
MLLINFVELRLIAERNRTLAGRPYATSGRPMLIHTCHAHAHTYAALWDGLKKFLLERHGRGVACVNQTRPHCVNQMGNTQSKPLVHGMGTAWYVWISLYYYRLTDLPGLEIRALSMAPVCFRHILAPFSKPSVIKQSLMRHPQIKTCL